METTSPSETRVCARIGSTDGNILATGEQTTNKPKHKAAAKGDICVDGPQKFSCELDRLLHEANAACAGTGYYNIILAGIIRDIIADGMPKPQTPPYDLTVQTLQNIIDDPMWGAMTGAGA